MTITTGVKLKPFMVPNFVIQETPTGRKQDGFKESPKFALHELDDFTLQALCDQFTTDVFEKVEKQRMESK